MSGNAQRRRQLKAIEKSNKALERNRCWDELEGIYQSCAAALIQHTVISQLASDHELLMCLDNPTLVAQNIRSLGQDLRTMEQELQTIHAQHAGKALGAQDGDEMMLAFTISEQYHLFMERHNGVLMPTVYEILEHFSAAEQKRNALRAQAAAQSSAETDPIDVAFREAPASQG